MDNNSTKQTPQPKLPDGWIKNRSKKHDRSYYFNVKTGQTQWHPPTVTTIGQVNNSAVIEEPKISPKPKIPDHPIPGIPAVPKKSKTPAHDRLKEIRKELHREQKRKTGPRSTTNATPPSSSSSATAKKRAVITKFPQPPESKKLSTNFKIPKGKSRPIDKPTQSDSKSPTTHAAVATASEVQTGTDAQVPVMVCSLQPSAAEATPSAVTPPSQPKSLPAERAVAAKCGTKRKCDAIEPAQPNSSVNNRLKRVRQECQEKYEIENRVDGDHRSSGEQFGNGTLPLSDDPKSLSEEQLSVVRARLIIELNSAKGKEPPCDEDVSMTSVSSSSSSELGDEEMDWQEIVFDEICAVRGNPATIDNPVFEAITKEPPKPMVLPAPSTVKNTLYIIIDTNIFLHDLPFVRDLVDNQDQKAYHPVIIVPYVVLQELDSLKMRTQNETISRTASQSIHFINRRFSEKHSALLGQSSLDDGQRLITIDSADDRILNCCLQLRAKGYTNNLVLLSNDLNLRNKALVSDIAAISHKKLGTMLAVE